MGWERREPRFPRLSRWNSPGDVGEQSLSRDEGVGSGRWSGALNPGRRRVSEGTPAERARREDWRGGAWVWPGARGGAGSGSAAVLQREAHQLLELPKLCGPECHEMGPN